MAVIALLRLAKLTGRQDLMEKAERSLRLFAGVMSKSPMAVGQMLVGLDFYLGPVREFAVALADNDSNAAALGLIQRPFRPNKVVAALPDDREKTSIGLLEGKSAIDGTVTTYVCQNSTCEKPLVGVEPLRAALAEPPLRGNSPKR